MPRNGSGTYQLPAGNPFVTGTVISSTVVNNDFSDIATALTGSIAADGQTPVTANIPFNNKRIIELADGVDDTDAASVGQVVTKTALASTASALGGAGLSGFLYSLLYAQSTAGWGIRTAGDCYNVLRDIPVAQWAAIVAGTSTDDHTSYIATANAAAKAAKLRLFFPGGKYNITPTVVTEVENWCGADAAYTSIYADCASYSGVVLRCVGSNSLRDITIREKNLIKTSGTLVQMSAATTSDFTGYQELHRVWMFGGLKAFDINNTFACKYTLCRMQFAGTGVNGTPIDEAGDNGYFTTQIFDQCIVADNNKNWNIAPAINSDCFTLIQGSTERPAVSKSTFVRLREVSLHDHYFEGSNTIIAASFSCDHKIYGAYVNGTAGIELVNGVNLRSIIEDYLPGSSTDVLTCSGDQTLSIRNSVFPGSGNTFSAAVVNFLGSVSINGTSYNGPRSSETAGASGVRRDVVPQSVSVSGAGATDAYRFLDINGTLVNQSQTGRFYVSAFDNATGANQAVYELRLESCGNGTTDATLTSVSRKVRGTDVGVSATPFTLANDGAGGAVKLQFQKNGAISQVNLRVIYDGVSV